MILIDEIIIEFRLCLESFILVSRPRMSSVQLQQLAVQKRTEGDGMENTDTSQVKEKDIKDEEFPLNCDKRNLIDTLIYKPKDLTGVSVPPPVITGQLVHLMPKNVTPIKKEASYYDIIGKKEPKFVPYEPYKAAVKPIIPYEKSKKKKPIKVSDLVLKPKEEIKSKENILSKQEVTNQILDNEGGLNFIEKENESFEKVSPEYEHDRKSIEEELNRLKEENTQLESQLKFQAQVNGELKNLLVAAMGEDLETRVHLLTEDKLQLARALLTSAQKLNTHQEQTEYLAGQCEVFRSKFLASSLMVEDLAKWKAALCQKASELQEIMKRVLEERKNVRENLICAHNNLRLVNDTFDLTQLKGGRKISGLKSANVVELASKIQKLSINLRLQLLADNLIPDDKITDFKTLESTTKTESQAEQLLLHPLALLGQPDAACNAVLGAAVALGSGYLHNMPAPACCSHCSGEIKQM